MLETLEQTRAALRDVAPRLVTLVRSVRDTDAMAVGSWTAGDVAAHLSHCFRLDTNALAGGPIPDAVVTAEGIAAATARQLAEDPVRDPAALADRIDGLAAEFDDAAARAGTAAVGWLQGLRLPPSVVAGHLLEECLVHGHDIAEAAGRPWPIDRDHALLAFEGFVLPLISALPPTALVDQETAGSFQGRFEVRLRRGGRTVMDFDCGRLTLQPGGARDVDARLSVDPAALLLLFIGRQGVAKPVLRGELAAWGRRPWRLTRLLASISPP